VREIKIELDDEITLLGWVVGVRHALAWHCLSVAWTVGNKYTRSFITYDDDRPQRNNVIVVLQHLSTCQN